MASPKRTQDDDRTTARVGGRHRILARTLILPPKEQHGNLVSEYIYADIN